MARTHLTLAALVSSTLDHFSPVSSRDYLAEIHDDVDAAVVEDAQGNAIVVEVPRTSSADSELRSEAQALDALTDGVRSVLPFSVPTKVLQAQVGESVALMTSLVPGIIANASLLRGKSALTTSIGAAVAAVHDLPTSVISDADRPVSTAMDSRVAFRDIVSRARATNMLPAPLGSRWEAAIDDDVLWQFEPTVIHGSLTADALLIQGDSVSGVVGWHGLRVGDPARDLTWLVNLDHGERESVLSGYAEVRRARVDPQILRRANLYSEVDVARWLLHGIDKKSPAIVDDAVDMLEQMVSLVSLDAEGPDAPNAEVLDASAVQDLLDETPVYRPLGTIKD